MAEKLDPDEIVLPEEIAISNMWEIAALVELLEQKGLLTRKEVLKTIRELQQRTPKVEPSAEAFPEPYLNIATENAVIDRIFEIINATGLTAHQAKNLLARIRLLIDLGERMGPKSSQ
jgi:dsDNA-specific endonuclease/ATPase MutS2